MIIVRCQVCDYTNAEGNPGIGVPPRGTNTIKYRKRWKVTCCDDCNRSMTYQIAELKEMDAFRNDSPTLSLREEQ